MNQSIVRKMVAGNFNYSELYRYLSEDDLDRGRLKLKRRFKFQTNSWNTSKNSEWVLRHYLAVKMIMSSTIMLTSLKFGKDRNVRVTEPYLVYYSLLNTARAVLYTYPIPNWGIAKLISPTHNKIISIVSDAVGQFNKESGNMIRDVLEKAKEYRELFSYKFPANGITDFTVGFDEAVEICSFLSEFAQFQSEILENANLSNKNIGLSLDREILKNGFLYKGKKYELFDDEDKYRLDYFVRKQSYPINLHYTLREGMVEDFFGAWFQEFEHDDEIDSVHNYDPDINYNLIFPIMW